MHYFVEKCVLMVFFKNRLENVSHMNGRSAQTIYCFPKYTYVLHLGKGVE